MLTLLSKNVSKISNVKNVVFIYSRKEVRTMVLEEDKIYSNAELAEWFQVTPKSFSNRKKYYLEKLKNYADFEEVKYKVHILQVYEDTYTKIRSVNRRIAHEHYDEAWPGPYEKPDLNTISGASNILYCKYEDQITVAEDSFYRYVLKETRVRYGTGKENDKGGTDGYRIFLWCTIDEETGRMRELNEGERKLLNELKQKYYDTESDIEFDEFALIEQGELPQNYIKQMSAKRQEAFKKVKRHWIAKMGRTLIRGTQLIREPKAF